MSYELTRASSPFSDFETQTHSGSWIAKVKDFSNEAVHKPGEPAVLCDNSVMEGQSSKKNYLRLYANGISRDDKGYVAIEFDYFKYVPTAQAHLTRSLLLSPSYKPFELSCVVSVIDSSENKRFSQSYVFPYNLYRRYHMLPTLTVDRLLKRDFLLRNRDDLLPGDCLSLHLDVTLRGTDIRLDVESPLEVVRNSLAAEETDDGTKHYLRLDSELAAHLVKASAFFQRMLETPAVERRTRSMKIDEDEYWIFWNVSLIVLGDTVISVPSMIHVCHMYILADMYLLPNAVESCRDLLTAFLREEKDPDTMEHVRKKVPDLQELAELYDDARLRQSIECYLTNGARSVPESDWKLVFGVVDNDANDLSSFAFRRIVEEETHSHEFYQ